MRLEDRNALTYRFAQRLERVCQERGWMLLPSGAQVTLAAGRHQLVELEYFQSGRDDLVRLYTTIGSAEDLGTVRLAAALRINAELDHGCLAVKNEDLIMTDTLMLRDADLDEIDASISFLAETADYYEKTIFETDQY
jgi:hypothetical protein